MPRILGITGTIASGKTSVGHLLLELGVERYIDADTIVHRLYTARQPIALQVEQTFGPDVMAQDGSVDRQALGTLVFQDAAAMQRLEQIVHPAVAVALKEELSQVRASGIAVIDAVKLLYSASGALCQSKWLIICSPEQQLVRLMARNQLSQAQAQARIHAQPDLASRMALVDEVIDNSGSPAEMRSQVVAALARFCQKFVA